jgi:hypothetical protein
MHFFGSLPTLAKIKMSLIQSSFFHKNAFDAIESNLPAFLIVVALYVQSFAHNEPVLLHSLQFI